MSVMNKLGYGLRVFVVTTGKGCAFVGRGIATGSKNFAQGIKGVKLDTTPKPMATRNKRKAA